MKINLIDRVLSLEEKHRVYHRNFEPRMISLIVERGAGFTRSPLHFDLRAQSFPKLPPGFLPRQFLSFLLFLQVLRTVPQFAL